MPTRDQLLELLAHQENELGSKLDRRFPDLAPRLTAGATLAFVLLEEPDLERLRTDDDTYAPAIGFILAAEFSLRGVTLLGTGRGEREAAAFRGLARNFPGAVALSDTVLVATDPGPRDLFCQNLVAFGGRPRQELRTTELLYAPRALLAYLLRAFPDDPPRKGDLVLTGTGPGAGLHLSRPARRLADLVGLDRFTRLGWLPAVGPGASHYLQPGQIVTVSGGMLGTIRIRILAP